MTMYGELSCRSASNARTTLGWSSMPTIFISRRNRDTECIDDAYAGDTTLSATTRSINRCRALSTRPMEPSTQAVHQDIAAKNQAASLAHEQSSGLKIGQLSLLDETFREGSRIIQPSLRGQKLLDFMNPRFGEYPRAFQVPQKFQG